MCGIVGYIGKKQAPDILIDSLKKLEYRGYDSAGFCCQENDKLFCLKRKGRVSLLESQLAFEKITSSLGIAHTRWATHGEPSEVNAHPHLSCDKNIAVVHNGIIENHSSLRKILETEGHIFSSETDSEVIAHLIEKFYQGDLETALIKALKLISGSYAIAAISAKENKIVCARLSSPLVLGVGDRETLIASDTPALLRYTKKVIYLNDGEIAVLNDKGYKIKSLDGKKIDPKIEEIKWSVEQIEKKGFKHFMLKEIFEQGETIANVRRGRIKKGKIKLSVDIDVKSLSRIIITACGTSWHSALIAKHYLEKLAGIPVEVDYASEFRYREPIVSDKDLMIVISQSGETADTLAALKEAKLKGANTLGVVNVIGSTISREVDSGIYLYAGPEIGVASTKAFTSQVVALLLLALYLRQEKGFPVDVKLLDSLSSLDKLVEETLRLKEKIKKIALKFKDSKNFLYLGRQLNFPVALEGALKLKEISYIHAEGYPAAEIKHGPIALIDKNMPVVFIATDNSLSEKIFSNMQEVKARGGRIITVCDKDSSEIKRLSDYVIQVPKSREELAPIIATIPLQLLAYYIADVKGLNVDKPRNLAKSVTVE
ncbi:MAG: glutamine--fructose-6-phosphate transaminase (isomerizing) [Candidatus Pacebacteria bacterium]|nr:glutamine--fructose-6-phosphate transaminase (isomerizing) [Candidatus Paceibacterota bacterium]